MKTKELIRQLTELDPDGEMEVCVDNVDIYFCAIEPSYWDGLQQVLVHDEELRNKCYSIIGGKYIVDGSKLVITTMTIEDAWHEATHQNKDFPIEVVGGYDHSFDEVKDRVKKWQAERDSWPKEEKITKDLSELVTHMESK